MRLQRNHGVYILTDKKRNVAFYQYGENALLAACTFKEVPEELQTEKLID